MVSWYVALVVVGLLATVGILSVAPYPGHCNVEVSVGVTELSLLLGTEFNIQSVNAQTTGPATILDWSAWLAGWAPFALNGQFSMTVAVGGVSAQKVESEWFPSVPFVNGAQYSASDTFHLGQVPTGPQSVAVTLTQNGQVVATGSTSTNVGC